MTRLEQPSIRSLGSTVSLISSEMSLTTHEKRFPIFSKKNGQFFEKWVCAKRPTYFENIVVTITREKTGSLPEIKFSIKNIKDIIPLAKKLAGILWFGSQPSIKLNGLILDFRSHEPNNIAHLILDIIPYYLYVKERSRQRVVLILRSVSQPFASLLDYFGVETFTCRGRIQGEFVKVWGSRGLAAYEIKHVFDSFGFDFFRQVYTNQKIPTKGLPEKIFLARRGQRGLLNHDDVENFLQSRGFVTIFMEDYSIHEQLALGAAAKDVVAVHGAAMSYLVMANQINSVVEISPPHVYHQLYPIALSGIVDKYAMTIPEFDEQVTYNGWSAFVKWKNAPFEVDINLLSAALDSVMVSAF